MSETYFQHADHFTRILNDLDNFKKSRLTENKPEDNNIKQYKEVTKNKLEKEEKLQSEAS